ncbi:hypothetical protein POTOM_005241 [Populus tomentosa]|uniref:Histone deacetylase domain-containing protein n=1 Tax=Populus tomentosa TaxID=118781 RepID=A0A8X8AIZ4_POPTO|nr:hypothetical protein POTOM_005241 [Populus tomentosa]
MGCCTPGCWHYTICNEAHSSWAWKTCLCIDSGCINAVAIDIDVVYGNGTAEGFYRTDRALTVSLHMNNGSWDSSHPHKGSIDELVTLFVLQFDPNGRKCLSMDGYTEIGRTVHSQANNTVAGAFLSSKKEDTTSHTQLNVFMQRLTVCWTFYSYYYVIPLHITLRMRLFLWKLLEPSGSTIKTWFHFSRNTIRRYCIQNSFLIYDSYAHILLKLRHATMETTPSFNMN